MFYISDFILPKKIIESACSSKGVGFIDLVVSFEKKEHNFIINNTLCIGNKKSIEETYWAIIDGYFKNFNTLHNLNLFSSSKEATVVYQKVQEFLDKLFIETNRAEGWKADFPIVQRIYQYPLVWTIMHHMICPIEDKPIKNLKIVNYSSPSIDIAKNFSGEENKDLNLDEFESNWIFLNSDCVYEPLSQASLLCSAIEAHGLCSKKVILKIKDNLFLFQKLKGLAELYFSNDTEADSFINFLFTFSEISNMSESLVCSDNIKMAKTMHYSQSSFWFAGLIEKMLEPVRGTDYSVHESLESLRDMIQKRVLKVQNESGREGATYEKLLRAIDDDSNGKYVLLEKALSEGRLW